MIFEFDDYRFDADLRQLSRGEERVTLRPMTVAVLAFLIDNRDRYVSQDEVMEAVWGHKALTTSVLSRSIHEIRQALADSAQEPRYVDTRYRVGYRFVGQIGAIEQTGSVDTANVEAVASETFSSAGGKPQAEPIPGGNAARLWGAAIVVAMLLAAGGWWAFSPSERTDQRGATVLAVNQPPQEPEAAKWFQQGLEALLDHRLGEARGWFERVLQRVPEHAPTLANLGDVLLQSGEHQKALVTLQSAQKRAAALPRIDQLRLEALMAGAEYRWTDAVKNWQTVFQVNPGDNGAGIRLGDAQLIAGDLDGAQGTLDQLRALPESLVDPLQTTLFAIRLATARGDHAKRLELARLAEQQARREISQAQARMEQGWALFGLGKLDDAAEMLSRVGAPEEPWVQAHGALLRANIARGSGEFPAAIEAFEQARALAEQLGDEILATTAQTQEAFVRVLTADMPNARTAIDEARARAVVLGSPRAEALTYDVETLYWQRAGDLARALEVGEKARDLFGKTGDLLGLASTCNQLGSTYARMGRWAEAEDCLDEALKLFGKVGDFRGQATALSNLAPVYARTGRVDKAREANEKALAFFEQLDADPDVARLQFNLALQDRRTGKLGQASTRLHAAMEAFDRAGAADSSLRAAAALVELYLMGNRLREADAIIQSHPGDDRVNALPRSMMSTARGHLAMRSGQFEAAASLLRDAHDMRIGAGLQDWAWVSQLDLIELEVVQGRSKGHAQRLEDVRRQFLTARDLPAASDAGLLLLRHWLAQGRTAEATALLAEMQPVITHAGDALLTLRFDILRTLQRADDDMSVQLTQLADKAEAQQMQALADQVRYLIEAGSSEAMVRVLAGVDRRQGVVPSLR